MDNHSGRRKYMVLKFAFPQKYLNLVKLWRILNRYEQYRLTLSLEVVLGLAGPQLSRNPVSSNIWIITGSFIWQENVKWKTDRKVLQCYKILGRRFTFSFAIFIRSKYYILKLTLCNSEHRNSNETKGEEADNGNADGGFFQSAKGLSRKDFCWQGDLWRAVASGDVCSGECTFVRMKKSVQFFAICIGLQG